MNSDLVIAIDLGKTNCRTDLVAHGVTQQQHRSAGLAGAANPDGIEAVTQAILEALSTFPVEFVAKSTIGVGAAGMFTAPHAAQEVSRRISKHLGVGVAVTSDILTAHVGALDGRPGTALVAGTGAVALAVAANGQYKRSDGWGPYVGDLGSGGWIGKQALRAVLKELEGREVRTSLTDRVQADSIFGKDPVYSINSSPNPAGLAASLTPIVMQEAQRGDDIAYQICAQAVQQLVATAQSAAQISRQKTVACLGGLVSNEWFATKLTDVLTRLNFEVVQPTNDALTGARFIAENRDLPHERLIYRTSPNSESI